MASVDKNQAIIKYLLQCPQIQDNPLFFNFAEAEDNNKQLLIVANDKRLNQTYIDGSVLKRFTFTIIDYRSVAYQALVNTRIVGTTIEDVDDENVEEMLDVQAIINWIEEQNDDKNYPDFGSDCIIESIASTTDNPNLNGVDTSLQPAIAKYHVSIIVQYLDTSKVLWK